MYIFRKINLRDIDNSFAEKVPFTQIEWLDFIKELKKIEPIALAIYDENEIQVGQFVGGLTRFLGIKVLGSPFWGWMGQHMGFDFYTNLNKSQMVDDLLDYAINELKVGYVQITDFKIDYPDIEQCHHKLLKGERYKTCYIDLTQPEEQLFKNLKGGYRTCIRKFTKMGGGILEDYSDEFIVEHHKQLEHVFTRAGKKTPDYKQKMEMLYHSEKFSKGANNKIGVYSIKAVVPIEENGTTVMKNIASSYYIHNGYMAMFTSNASYSEYLPYCANQALTWHAMIAFKNAGIHYLDMGGGGDYKLNFSGGAWQPRPIIIHSSNWLNEFIIIGLKRQYGKFSSIIGKSRNWINRNILRRKHFGEKN